MNWKKMLSLLLSAILAVHLLPVTSMAASVSASDYDVVSMPEISETLITPVLTASPSKIPAGTVDPTVIITSNVGMQDFAGSSLRINTAGTGLTLSSSEYDLESYAVVLHFQGTAESGTITGDMPADVFWQIDADVTDATFFIPIEGRAEAYGGEYHIVFAANNGKDTNQIINVESGTPFHLPECMFDAPEGKVFSGWSINENLYRPGDQYTLHGDTAVIANWADNGESKTGEVTSLVRAYVDEMTDEEKNDPDAIDLATLYAETFAAKAASQKVDGNDIVIASTTVGCLEETAVQACAEAEAALIEGGVNPARELFSTITILADTTDFTIQVDPNILTVKVDKVRVETAGCAITFKLEDLSADLSEDLIFDIHISKADPNTRSSSDAAIDFSTSTGKQLTNPVTVSLPSGSGEKTYRAIVDSNGAAVASKYNPATKKIDGKVNSSGTYSEKNNPKDFSDISKKSAEMQKAIRYLASKDIIKGRTATTFSPDQSISRAEIAKLLVVALNKLSSSATADFADVTRNNWYYSAAASSQKHGLVKGFDDKTFRGTQTINKVQIVAIASRVLTSEMKYKTPSNVSAYLEKYTDGVAKWARPEVALATKERLVVLRTDGTFAGNKNMTRGDAAIVIYRLFQRLW